jgi:hypothetical protein
MCSSRVSAPHRNAAGLHDPEPRSDLWRRRHTPIASHGHSGQTDCTGLTLTEWLCRTADRIDPARVFGPHYCLGRGTYAPDFNLPCRLLQLRQNASVVAQGCADFSSDSRDRNHSFTPDPRWASPSLRTGLSFRYTQDKKRPRGSESKLMALAAQAISGTKTASQSRNTKCLKKQRRRLSCVANTPKPM